jgi:hypothetical protein
MLTTQKTPFGTVYRLARPITLADLTSVSLSYHGSHADITVKIAGLDEVAPKSWAAPEATVRVTLRGFTPVNSKGPNYLTRLAKSFEARMGVPSKAFTYKSNDPLPTLKADDAEAVLAQVTEEAKRWVDSANDRALHAIKQHAGAPEGVYKETDFPVARAKVAGVKAAYDAIKAQLKAAKDELHAEALATYIKEVGELGLGDLIDLDTIATTPRATSPWSNL